MLVVVIFIITIITPRGAPFAATADPARQIVIFVDGTSLAQQRAIVTLLDPQVQILHELTLINGLAVQFSLLVNLTTVVQSPLSHPEIQGVYDDSIAITGQETSLTNELNPPTSKWFGWGEDDVHIHVPPSYNKGIWGVGVTVAVLDSGIDLDHPDLASNIVGGFNAIAERQSYNDDNGHGTHIAGIIAATVNGHGIIGTAAQAQLMAVKVLDATASGYLSDFINGLQWVRNHGIRVLNMSLSFAQDSVPLQRAIQRLYQAGAIMVASVGNCGQAGGGVDEDGGSDGGGTACDPSQPAQNAVLYPAAYPKVMAVAATDVYNHITDYSRYGPEVDMAAPGGAQASARLLSTVPGGGYGLGSGTSQAAAHASGVVALALRCQPSLFFDQVVALLQSTARHLDGYSSNQQGAGLIDAPKLIGALQ